jgi:hypothetical protein
MRATRAAGVGVRGHGPLLRGKACIDTTNDRTIRASRQSRSETSLLLGVGARHARDMRCRRGCSRAWPAPTRECLHRHGKRSNDSSASAIPLRGLAVPGCRSAPCARHALQAWVFAGMARSYGGMPASRRHGTARQTIERFGMWVFTVSAPSSGKSPGAISRMQVAAAQGSAAALASGGDPQPEARVLQSRGYSTRGTRTKIVRADDPAAIPHYTR